MKKFYRTLAWCTLFVLGLGRHQANSQESAYALAQHQDGSLQGGEMKIADLLARMKEKYNISIVYEPALLEGRSIKVRPDCPDMKRCLETELTKAGLKLEQVKTGLFVIVDAKAIPATKPLQTSADTASKTEALPVTPAPAEVQVQKPALTVKPTEDGPITGKVKDKSGSPLPGVNIVLKGNPSIGTISDFNGNFTLTVPAEVENPVLIFSYIGFKTQEVSAEKGIVDLTLEESIAATDEVVVLGFNQSVSRRELSGSISSVKGEAISRAPVSGLDQALQGQVSGLQVTTSSGTPGGASKLTIRGNSSINASNSPLYVIDGIPLSVTNASYDARIGESNQPISPLNQFNTNDIANIEVLKDAAAIAIYGSRGANGVVLITTKRGKTGQSNISFSAYAGVSSVRKKLDVLNATQWREYYKNALTNSDYSTDAIDSLKSTANTNWQDEIYRQATQRNYQFSIDGGSEKTKYYVSAGYFDQQGTVKNSGYNRYAMRMNLDQRVKDNFKVGTTLNLSNGLNNRSVRTERAIGNGGVIMGALGQIPVIPVYDSAGNYARNPFVLLDNPVGNLLETNIQARQYQILGNVFAEWEPFKFLPNLTYRPSVSYEVKNQKEDSYYTTLLPATQNAAADLKGLAKTATRFEYTNTIENTLNYKLTVKDKAKFNFMLSNVFQVYHEEASYADRKTFSSDIIRNVGAGAAVSSLPYSYTNDWAINSYLGRVLFDYQGRYSATGSMRYDGSSRFLGKYHYGAFPSASFAWNISEEKFFSKGDWADLLKIRLSYGLTGNQDGIALYPGYTTVSNGAGYPGLANAVSSGIIPATLGNKELHWETTAQGDVGIDYSIFGGKALFTFDVYNKKTTDLLLSRSLPASAGYSNTSYTANIGSVQNRGVEFSVTSTNVSTPDFQWTTTFNYSLNRNKVLSLSPDQDSAGVPIGQNIYRKGLPIGSFYGYKFLGIYQDQGQIDAATWQDKTNLHPGDVIYQDVNGDGLLNDKDLQVIGNPNPKFIAGLNNTINFYNFDLTVFFQGVFGNEIMALYKQQTEGMNDAMNQETTVLDRWTPNNHSNTLPRAAIGFAYNNQVSSRYIYDGSYIRLRNVTLGYTLPKSLLTKLKIGSFRVYATGQNLLTFTDYPGYDPEVNSNGLSATQAGIDYGSYPQSKTYIFGVSATF
ncbi:MAG: TonB-dependent receptor [Bacteroidota bacterium]